VQEKDFILLKDLCNNYKEDIVDGPFGANLKREHYQPEGVPVLKIQNIKPFNITLKKMDFVTTEKYEELKRHSYRSGDIIMTKLGDPLGESAIVDDIEGGLIVADLVRIRAQKIDTKYLCYHLNSPVTNSYINAQQKGTTRPRVRISVVRELPIYAPSIEEQKRIVAILDQAFADIDKARALTEQNLKNARELFESYLQKVFSQRGEGWEPKCLAEICTFSSGGTPSKKNDAYWVGDIPWVSGRDMKGTQLSDTTLHISQSAVDESSTRMAPEGSLLILVRGMGLAHGAQVVELLRPCAFNQDIRAIHLASGIVPRFLVLALRHRINNSSNVLSNAAHGTLKIDMDQLKGLEITLPSAEKQAIIVAKINELLASTDELRSRYQAKLESLDELKKSLLQKAFSGELTTSSAEAAA
jgi:type I restriction enzyme S subunit